MALPKFYCEVKALEPGDELDLSEHESHHAYSVRRLQEGAAVLLLNGKGYKAQGVVLESRKRRVRVRVDSVQRHAHVSRAIHVAVAIPKGDRQKVLLEMLVQQGIASFTPLVCEFSVTSISEKLQQKWLRYIRESFWRI